MRILISVAMLASVCGPLAGTAVAADLDYPPPPPYYEPHPVPPAFVPGPVPPVYFRGPRLYPRPILYPRPYRFYARPAVVGVYGGPGPYVDGGRPFVEGGYGRPYPREPRPYGEPGAGPGFSHPGYPHEAEIDRHRGEGYGGERGPDRREFDHRDRGERGIERSDLDRHDRGGDQRYGHYLSHEELDRRASRERGERDHYADREQPRDFDR